MYVGFIWLEVTIYFLPMYAICNLGLFIVSASADIVHLNSCACEQKLRYNRKCDLKEILLLFHIFYCNNGDFIWLEVTIYFSLIHAIYYLILFMFTSFTTLNIVHLKWNVLLVNSSYATTGSVIWKKEMAFVMMEFNDSKSYILELFFLLRSLDREITSN